MSIKTRERLLKHLARLEGYSRDLGKHRDRLVARAQEQAATTAGPIRAWSEHVDAHAGEPSTILSHRRLKTLLRERQRLLKIVDDHEGQRAAERQPESL